MRFTNIKSVPGMAGRLLALITLSARRVERVKKWEKVVTRICYAEMSFVVKNG